MKVKIYGRENCQYCEKAKELCQSKEIDFDYIDIREHEISKEQLGYLCGKVIETVPQIFVDDKHVGGFTEFNELINAQEARELEFDIEL
jgi:glutaredoxin 1